MQSKLSWVSQMSSALALKLSKLPQLAVVFALLVLKQATGRQFLTQFEWVLDLQDPIQLNQVRFVQPFQMSTRDHIFTLQLLPLH